MKSGMSKFVLASGSRWRAQMLRDAGLDIETDPADIDERSVEAPLLKADLPPEDIATVLAEAKAMEVSERHPGVLVLGADQVLSLNDKIYSKPETIEQARRNLLEMRGQTHVLHSALACVRDGETIWRYVEDAPMKMRSFTPEFLGRYLAEVGDMALASVGSYQIEGPGIQLFEKVEANYFTIIGLPLLPLLAFLREQGVIET